MKKYKIAPDDTVKWKCDWFNCAGGYGLAGNGICTFRGDWNKKKCPYFISEDDLNNPKSKNRELWVKMLNSRPRFWNLNKIRKLVKLIKNEY